MPGSPLHPTMKIHRNSIYLIIEKRSHRVDDVALAGVLHIDDRDLPRRQMISCCESCTISLISRYNMMPGINTIGIHKIIT